MTKIMPQRIAWLALAALIFILDQISKWAITEKLFTPRLTGESGLGFLQWYANTPDILPGIRIEMTSFFNLVMAWNTGVSFSMFNQGGDYMPLILIIVALLITALFTYWLLKAPTHWHSLCYSLVIGGALGNVFDRARFGAVIDFLDFHILGYHWPAFNVADMAVVCGIVLLVIISFIFDFKDKQRYREASLNNGNETHETP